MRFASASQPAVWHSLDQSRKSKSIKIFDIGTISGLFPTQTIITEAGKLAVSFQYLLLNPYRYHPENEFKDIPYSLILTRFFAILPCRGEYGEMKIAEKKYVINSLKPTGDTEMLRIHQV